MLHPDNYNNEEYIDFRQYPLIIDWQGIEDDKSQSIDIYNKYNYFGAAIFACFQQLKDIKLTEINILKTILESYNNKLINNNNSNNNNSDLVNFIKILPSLEKLNNVVNLGLTKQELPLFKIILDIYENYLTKNDGPIYNVYNILILDFD